MHWASLVGNEKANVLCVSMVRSTLSIGLTIMNNYFCFVFDFLNRSGVCFIFYGDNSLLSSSIACRLLNCTSYYKNVSWTSMRQTSSQNTHILCEFWFCLRSFSQFVWLNMLLLPPVRHLDKGINVNDSAPLWNSSITLPTLRASLFPCGTRAVRKKTQKRSQSIFIESDRKQEKRSEWAL